MGRVDTAPDRYPMTTGLQFSADGEQWTDVDSGSTPYASSTDYKFVRINPKLFDNKYLKPSMLKLRPSADDAKFTGNLGDATTPRGIALLKSSYYEAIWVDPKPGATFGLAPASAASETIDYMIFMRELDPDERDTK